MVQLHPISTPTTAAAEAVLDIVFVHGIDGDPFNSWRPDARKGKPTDRSTSWLGWLAEDVPNSMVWSLGHGLRKFYQRGQTQPLYPTARLCLEVLAASGLGKRPIVFIAHSMGGLLVKQMLMTAAAPIVEGFGHISAQTRAVLFLATPHKGVDLAEVVRYLQWIRPTENAHDLRHEGGQLEEVYHWYITNAERMRIRTVAFYEGKTTRGHFIVDKASADPGLPNVTPICVQDADHHTISRVKSRESETYRVVLNLLQQLLSDTSALTSRAAVRFDWDRDVPPFPERSLDGTRQAIVDKIEAELRGASDSRPVVLVGAPGVGKGLAAKHIANDLHRDLQTFPGGVIFEDLGEAPTGRRPNVEQILAGWLSRAPSMRGSTAQPGLIRTMLHEYGPVLVIFRNVWEYAHVQPLWDVLPPSARVLITTENRSVARGFGAPAIKPVEFLLPTESEAVQLLVQRCGDADILSDAEAVQLLTRLALGLGRHPMALDIAGDILAESDREDWSKIIDGIVRSVREGRGYGAPPVAHRLNEPVHGALDSSYHRLAEDEQGRYRTLGVFAPDGDFGTSAAALLWELDEYDATYVLSLFRTRGLVKSASAAGGKKWVQPNILRSLAIEKLRINDELEQQSEKHAHVYLRLLQDAVEHDTLHVLFAEYAQLRHALTWAAEHELDIALELVRRVAHLQSDFGLVDDALAWAQLVSDRISDASATEHRAETALLLAKARCSRAERVHSPDHAAQLRQAQRECDKAAELSSLSAAPDRWLEVQITRARILELVARIPEENSLERLDEALNLCREGLQATATTASSLVRATVLSEEGWILRELADNRGTSAEERKSLLRDALAVFSSALEVQRPEVDPRAYVSALGNRATVKRLYATHEGEPNVRLLREATDEFREALQYLPAQVTPKAHADVKSNLGLALVQLSRLDTKDVLRNLTDAIAAYNDAIDQYPPEFFTQNYVRAQMGRVDAMALVALHDRNEIAILDRARKCCDECLDLAQSLPEEDRDYELGLIRGTLGQLDFTSIEVAHKWGLPVDAHASQRGREHLKAAVTALRASGREWLARELQTELRQQQERCNA